MSHRLPLATYPVTVYYDGSCQLCTSEIHNMMARNIADRLVFADCSPVGFAEGPAPRDTLMNSIHAVDADGRVFTGIATFRVCYEAVGLPFVSAVLAMPVIGTIAERAYPVLVRNRYRLPRGLVSVLFERASLRAARRAARRSAMCAEGTCTREPARAEGSAP